MVTREDPDSSLSWTHQPTPIYKATPPEELRAKWRPQQKSAERMAREMETKQQKEPPPPTLLNYGG